MYGGGGQININDANCYLPLGKWDNLPGYALNYDIYIDTSKNLSIDLKIRLKTHPMYIDFAIQNLTSETSSCVKNS